jgi:hypothetical protein
MSDHKYTYTRENWRGIEVLCVESQNLCRPSYADIKEILEELNEIMFLPKRVIYKGYKGYWEGFDSENMRYMYTTSGTKENAKRSIVIHSI